MDRTPTKYRAHLPLHPVDVSQILAEHGVKPDSDLGRFITRLEQPEPDWVVTVEFEVGADGAIPTGMGLRSTQGQPVTAAVWREVKPAEAIRQALDGAPWVAADQRTRQRAGRPPEHPQDLYVAVAQIYRTAEAAGEPPVKAVRLAYGHTEKDTRARNWVAKARALGLLDSRRARD